MSNEWTVEGLKAFEERIRQLWEAGELPYLVHLCGGNEAQLIKLFEEVTPGDWVIGSHRCHYHYLLAGGDQDVLEAEIRAGRSMYLFNRATNFLSTSILAGLCSTAAGLAYGLRERGSANRVWCFLGDGAEEQGHVYEAVHWVEAWHLPCVFVIEDNDRSVATPKRERRHDFRWHWPARCVRRYRYTATWPHAGSGCAHHIKWQHDRKPDFHRTHLSEQTDNQG